MEEMEASNYFFIKGIRKSNPSRTDSLAPLSFTEPSSALSKDSLQSSANIREASGTSGFPLGSSNSSP